MPALKKTANKIKNRLFRAALQALVTVSMTCLLAACALIQKAPPGKPLDMITANAVLNDMQDQNSRVSTFYSIGTITVKDWKWDTDADMLVIGQKDPFRLKIEITHQWKGPVLHILIDDRNLEALSFSEKRLYIGPFTPEGLSRFIPGTFFDPGLIWSALRAYPCLSDYNSPLLFEENSISILDERNKLIETIALHPESLYPGRISFPEHGLNLFFSHVRDNSGIRYAEEVKIQNIKGSHDLIIKNSKMVFNQPVPEKIFTIQRLPGHETFYMDEDDG